MTDHTPRRRAVAGADRRRAAGRRCRPPGPARRRRAHAPRTWPALLYRSLTERLLALPDHLVLYPAHYSGSVCGRGLSGQPGLRRSASSGATTERCGSTPRTRSSRRSFEDIPPAPEQQAEILAANRAGRPLSGDAVTDRARRARAAREPAAVRAAGRAQRVRRRDGRPGALDAAADRREEFGLASKAAVLSFIVAFGLAKAFTNLGAGGLAARLGRRRLLIAGWVVALPVPLLIAVAPSWGWIVAANVLLGVNQGLAWSMTVVMKIDLVGPQRRGLALGLNEAAGYGGVALAAAASGWLAAEFAARDVLVVAGAAIAVIALVVSVAVRARHRRARRARAVARTIRRRAAAPPLRDAFPDATWRRPRAARVLAGRPRQQPQRRARLGTGAAVPRRARRRASARSASSPGIYPAVWGVGADLDRPLVRPRRAQAADRRRHAAASRRARRCSPRPTARSASPPRAPSVLGVGTALVYPTLIAAISDAVARSRARRWSASTASGVTWATSPAG